MVLIEIGGVRPAAGLSKLLSNSIQQHLTKVRLECSLSAIFEAVNSLKCLKQRFLDKVVRIGQVARPSWKSTGCPAPEHWQIAGEQDIERLAVPTTGPLEEIERGLRLVQLRVGAAAEGILPCLFAFLAAGISRLWVCAFARSEAKRGLAAPFTGGER